MQAVDGKARLCNRVPQDAVAAVQALTPLLL